VCFLSGVGPEGIGQLETVETESGKWKWKTKTVMHMYTRVKPLINDHLVTETTSVQDYVFAMTTCTIKFIVTPHICTFTHDATSFE